MITIPAEGQYNMYNTDFCPHANFIDFIETKHYRGLLKHFLVMIYLKMNFLKKENTVKDHIVVDSFV